MAISKKRMENATTEYNDLMYKYGLDHLAIHKENEHWNLRDMVSEVCYQYETATTNGYSKKEEYDDACDDYEEYKNDDSKIGRMRFKEATEIIKHYRAMLDDYRKFAMRYRKEASQMKCTTRHSSKWD